MDWLGVAGLGVAALGVLSYLGMLFVVQDFTYRTWVFDGVVGLGVLLAVVGWLTGGRAALASVTALVGLAWFLLTRRELAIHGSERLRRRPGDNLPAFSLLTTGRIEVTDRDVVRSAPALLVFYRGWWCPSHKAQLDELVAAHERLAAAGLAIYACSVDGPEESQPVQDRVGDAVTILCGVDDSLLDDIGIRDERGAPWYDRLIFGAKQQDISMPAALVVDDAGIVVYAHRSTRVDDRPAPDQILASLRRA